MENDPKTTILNVDDDDAGRYSISRTLRQAGFDVKEAFNGREALRFAEEQPDLILLDVNLPDIGGFDVCRMIKNNPLTSHIPVLHLSATFLDDESKVRGLETADGYLTQPVEPPVLIATIKALLRMKRAEEGIKRRNEELSALNTIAGEVSSSLNLQEVLDRALDKVLEVTGLEACSIYLLDQEVQEVVLATYRGASKEYADQVRTFKMGESLTGRVAESGEPVLIDDLTADPKMTTTLVTREKMRSFAGIPIKSKEKVRGVMNVASRQYHPFSPEEIRLYTAIADQIGVAIENARLHEAVQWELAERKRAEEALRESEKRLAADLEAMARLQKIRAFFLRESGMQMVLDEIVEAAIAIAGADMGNIQLLDPQSGSLKIVAHRGFEQPFLDFWDRVYAGQGTCGSALERGERVIVEDITQSPIFVGTPALDVQLVAGVRAVQSTPLVSRSSRLLGVFSTHFRTPHRPDERVLRLLDLLARQTTDIIERAQSEEELRESEERYRTILDNIEYGYFEVDIAGNFTFFNDPLCIILGYSRDEMMGMNNRQYMDKEHAKKVYQAFNRVYTTGEPYIAFDWEIVRKDGAKRFVESSVSLIRDSKGEGIGFRGIGRDITERKRAEEERERLLAEIAAKNQEMESFVYTISHDLKAPLVSLSGFSSVLQKDYESQLGEEGRHYLERIQANVAHMEALTTSLLELARIGRVVGSFEEIDVAALLREIRNALAVRLKEAGAEFVVQEPLPTVHADRGRIHQVFANLIDNAVKFRSAERALRIEVGCRQESGFCRFHVADNGIGIAPQYHEQIFTPFRKLHPEIEGVGIGLALVKRIVDHHGGCAWVESELGKGSTFYFTIPVTNDQ